MIGKKWIAHAIGNAGQTNYSAAKAGITGVSMTLAKEWGRMIATANCVAYGFIKTRLTEATADGNATANIEGAGNQGGRQSRPDGDDGARHPAGLRWHAQRGGRRRVPACIPESDYVSGQKLMCSGGMTGI